MVDMSDNSTVKGDTGTMKAHAMAIGRLLSDARAEQTVVLDVSRTCGFADYMVISTALSQGHLRGLIVQLDDLLVQRSIDPLHPRRRDSEFGWVLIDLGFAVVHLMSKEMRDFYELERLWFGSQTIFGEEG